MTTRSVRRTLERVPPPIYFVACLVAGWGLGLVRPLPLGLTRTYRQLFVALPLFLVAALLGLWALRLFGQRRTSNAPFTTPTALLTSGPYRVSRNPMYLSQLLILSALGALLNSSWVLAFVPVLGFALNRFIIPGEEARLHEAFGERYEAYRREVRRWL